MNAKPANRSQKRTITIRPTGYQNILEAFVEIWHYRELLLILVIQHISLRYKQSLLGITWIWLQPALATLIFTLVFGNFAKFPSDGVPYPVFVLSGLVLWTYLTRVFNEGSTSLLTHIIFLQMTYCPRLMLPMITVISTALDFFIAELLVFGLMLIFGVSIPWTAIFIPLILVCIVLFCYFCVLILAAITAIYRDANFFMPFFMQIMMFVSAVVYPISFVPERFHWAFELNPFATIISFMRWATLGSAFPSSLSLVAFGLLNLILLFTSVIIFRRLEPTILDKV